MLKRSILFLLLLSLIFNSAHAFFFDCNDNHYVQEYVYEMDHPTQKGDICDNHFVFHMPLFLSTKITIDFPKQNSKIDLPLSYHFQQHFFSLLKPPKNSL